MSMGVARNSGRYSWEGSFIKEIHDYISLYCANRKHEDLDIKVFAYTRPEEFDKKRFKIQMSIGAAGKTYCVNRVERLEELYTTYTCVIDEMHSELLRKVVNIFEIKKVIFNNPATIVFWADGKKTVVKCSEGDTFDPEKGLAMAFIKKHMGNDNSYHKIFKKWIPDTCTTNKEFEKTSSKRYPWGELIEEDDSK